MAERIFERSMLRVRMHTVVGITGASGVVYGVRVLEALPGKKTVILSKDAKRLAEIELGMKTKDIYAKADDHFENEDLYSPLASGSTKFDSFIIAPCSTSTLSKLACGIQDNLITRIGAVALKERRKLVLVVRETPLSSILLSNMERLARAGAIVMPASPAFYPMPKDVEDMIDFIVGRVLDLIGVQNDLYRRWTGPSARAARATGNRGSRRTRR